MIDPTYCLSLFTLSFYISFHIQTRESDFFPFYFFPLPFHSFQFPLNQTNCKGIGTKQATNKLYVWFEGECHSKKIEERIALLKSALKSGILHWNMFFLYWIIQPNGLQNIHIKSDEICFSIIKLSIVN